MKYDLLFATSAPLTSGVPGIVMKLFRKKPFVFEVRELWAELPREMGGITQRKISALQLSMIPNACDLELFKPAEHKRAGYISGIGKDDFVAVFCGAHGMANGLDAVLIHFETRTRYILEKMQKNINRHFWC